MLKATPNKPLAGCASSRGLVRRRGGAVACALALLLAACARQPVDPAWSGYVEGDYLYVSSPLAGTLAQLSVQRGQEVASGAPLFALDAEAERLAREEAAARLEASRAQAADTTKGRRADEIAAARARLAQARAQATLAASELARERKLAARGFVSKSRIDDARARLESARAQVDELSAALRFAQLPARPDERAAAGATAQAQQQALRQAQWREQQMQRAAPLDALVADTFFRAGEWVPAGAPVVSLLAPGAIKARFFVPESEVAAIAIGQPVTIRCDGCGEPIAARIDFVSPQAEYTPPVIYSNEQRAKLVFLVEARPAAGDAVRLKPGQPIDVRHAAP